MYPTIRRKSKNGTNHAEGSEPGLYTTESQTARYTKEKWTCENESYRFPMNESPKDPWEQCFDLVDETDEELYKELQDEISGLLVVASLFLAVVTAFSIMSFAWLRADDNQLSAALLGDIVKLLNGTDARGTVPPRDATTLDFSPKDSDIIVNQLWFLSMTLSLSAVVVGTLCLQWLSTFRRKQLKRKPYNDTLALRQLRFEGLMGWGVPHVPGFLLLAVQGAIILFAIGLMYLLWSVDNRVAVPVVIAGGVVALLLLITAIMPLLQSVLRWIFPSTLVIPQCPYKSPISWVLHRGCVLFSIIVTLPFSLLPPFVEVLKWRSQQIKLLTDYTWELFDDAWCDQRKHRGPQTSKTGSTYSYYCVQGLASAMEILLFKPNVVHIAHKCLQGIYGTTAANEVFESIFGQDKSAVNDALVDYNRIPSSSDDGHAFNSHIRNLKKDFLSAHTLQRFVSQNEKLHHTLLPHRVELYVRIKNSFHNLKLTSEATSDAESQYKSTSIECPIRAAQDAETLSLELLDQFIRCADWYLDGRKCEDSEVNAINFVLDAMERLQTLYGTKATNTDQSPSVNVNRVGSVPKSPNEPDTVGSPVDKGPSTEVMELHKAVRGKLERYEQRAKDEHDKKFQQQSKEGRFPWSNIFSPPSSQCHSPC